MRPITTLSYSGLNLWETRPEEFFLTRLSEKRPPRTPQERPAAAGSAFDAYVKARLQDDLTLGSFQGLFDHYFTSQVEPHNRDWAEPVGKHVFDCYVVSGFYQSLRDMMDLAPEPPRFEFSVEAVLNGVPFNGKPDARWVTPGGVSIVHDWKMNGYCSKSAVSPYKSYELCCDGYVAAKQSKSHGSEHKEFLARQHGDVITNASYLEAANPAWADQLSLYGWALGEKIGDENVVLSIHQIVAKPMPEGRPQLRVAQYRARVSKGHQLKLAERLKRCWGAITSGHVFPDMTRADSDARCELLESSAVGLQSDGSSREDFFAECTRSEYRG